MSEEELYVNNTKSCTEGKPKKENVVHSCHLCGKQLSNKYALSRHLKICDTTPPNKCSHCDACFISEELVNNHLPDCLQALKHRNSTLENSLNLLAQRFEHQKKEIMTIRKQLETALSRLDAKTSRAGAILVEKLGVYDIAYIQEKFSKIEMSEADMKLGLRGLALCILPCLYNDSGIPMVGCTDRSRGAFVTMDSKGGVSKDPGGLKLVNSILEIFNQKAKIIKQKARTRYNISGEIESRKAELLNLQQELRESKRKSSCDENDELIAEANERIAELKKEIQELNDTESYGYTIESQSLMDIYNGVYEVQNISTNSRPFWTTLALMLDE